MPKKRTFEQALLRLEEIGAAVEDAKTPLEASLKLYTEAAELFAFCKGSLDAAEAQVLTLRRAAAGEAITEPFLEDDDHGQ